MCRFYRVSRTGNYSWQRRKLDRRKRKNAELVLVIKDVHDRSLRTYGGPHIAETQQQQGFSVSKNRVARMMQASDVVGRTASLMKTRDLKSVKMVQTYLILALAVFMVLYSRRILGQVLGKNRKIDVTLRALNYTIRNGQPGFGAYFHSDRGIEYTGLRYRRWLKQVGFIQSMNRPCKMADNGYMELFFFILMSDVYHGLKLRTVTSIHDVLRN